MPGVNLFEGEMNKFCDYCELFDYPYRNCSCCPACQVTGTDCQCASNSWKPSEHKLKSQGFVEYKPTSLLQPRKKYDLYIDTNVILTECIYLANPLYTGEKFLEPSRSPVRDSIITHYRVSK